ncbi:DNA-directed RNA polymerases I, II, and III subunit RPABC3-like [Antechinus flavipes]|uniref:DNA-directed RNA polymerases I, II, and III subunit RPABC3-like n=1 Tax=Antechinus flavipes TaxID=38775 RepID=UPI002235C23B|nr:DNA-directed RNA polymerases I, II, and III subunit RPABC3-like [Antechinus flavipes]
MDLILDISIHIYPIDWVNKFHLGIDSTFYKDGEYNCTNDQSSAFACYAALLVHFQRDSNNLYRFEVDSRIYLLVKKLAF